MTSAAVTQLRPILSPAAPSLAADMQTTLKSAETAFDTSAALAGELIGKTIQAATEAGVHRVNIQKNLLQLISSINHSVEAQMELQRYHQACRSFMGKLNMVELGWGDVGDTPDGLTTPSGMATA